MRLGGEAIHALFSAGHWTAHRFDGTFLNVGDLRIGPNSVDVTLHPKILVPMADDRDGYVLDPRADITNLAWAPCTFPYILAPGAFILAAAAERFNCTRPAIIENGRGSFREGCFAQMYDGRSTMGRLGIASHVTAGFGDYGFSGAFTLEVVNHFPYAIRLDTGMRVGQVSFEEVYRPKLYAGAYNADHNDGPVAPVLGPTRF